MSIQRPIASCATLLAAVALAAACRSAEEEAPPPPEPAPEAPPTIDERIAEAGDGEGLEAVEYEVVDRGTQLGLEGPMARVFRSQAGWREAWSSAPATRVGQQQQGAPQVDQVDWSEHMLAVVALGQRPTAGYGVEVQGVERAGGFLRVRVAETEPPPDAMQAQVVTHPYVVLRLARFEGPVIFVIE